MSQTFDIRDGAQLNGWMIQTIQYAMIASGKEEVEHDEVMGVIRETLPQSSLPFKDVVSLIIGKAQELMGEPHDQSSAVIEDSFLVNVMQWVHRTVAAVWVGKNKPFDAEKVEAKADELVSPVQGNRRQPTRAALDGIVRRLIEWGNEQLNVPVGA